MDQIFSIIILVISVVIHEVSHGFAAQAQGDLTAKYAGRLTLNPLRHIDPFGSVILPIILAIIPPHMVFGWAKPVPINPYNFRNQKYGEVLVALAGPASNFAIAIIFGLLIRANITQQFLPDSFLAITASLVLINILLAVFNMVPIAPLDGSKVLFGLLQGRLSGLQTWMENNYIIMFLIFVFFLWQFIDPLVLYLFSLITGLSI